MISLLKKIYLLLGFLYIQFRHYLSGKRAVRSLSKIVSGKRVVVFGSGPSIELCKEIPDDIILAGCNFSPTFFSNNTLFSVYATSSFALYESGGEIFKMMENRTFSWIHCDKFSVLPKKHKNNAYKRDARSILFFSPVISVSKLLIESVYLRRRGQHYFFSTGIQLILFCIAAGAKEVYVLGIEAEEDVIYFQNKSYEHDDNLKVNKHATADLFCLHEIVKKQLPVFTPYRNTSINKIIPYKKW